MGVATSIALAGVAISTGAKAYGARKAKKKEAQINSQLSELDRTLAKLDLKERDEYLKQEKRSLADASRYDSQVSKAHNRRKHFLQKQNKAVREQSRLTRLGLLKNEQSRENLRRSIELEDQAVEMNNRVETTISERQQRSEIRQGIIARGEAAANMAAFGADGGGSSARGGITAQSSITGSNLGFSTFEQSNRILIANRQSAASRRRGIANINQGQAGAFFQRGNFESQLAGIAGSQAGVEAGIVSQFRGLASNSRARAADYRGLAGQALIRSVGRQQPRVNTQPGMGPAIAGGIGQGVSAASNFYDPSTKSFR